MLSAIEPEVDYYPLNGNGPTNSGAVDDISSGVLVSTRLEPEVDYYPLNGNGPTINGVGDDISSGVLVSTRLEPEVPGVVRVGLNAGKSFPSTTVSYHALSYDVTISAAGCSCERTTKRILHELRQDMNDSVLVT